MALRFLVVKPDIIHVQWIPLVAEGVPVRVLVPRLAKRRGIKLVYTVHNLLPHDSGPSLHKTFAEVYRLMDALICHTQETKDRLIEEFGLEDQKIWIIPHGPLFYDYQPIDKSEAKRQLGFLPEHCLVLYQGLVRPYKGIDFLLDAWKTYKEASQTPRLVIAGRGDKRHMASSRPRSKHRGDKPRSNWTYDTSHRKNLRFITKRRISPFTLIKK